MFSQISGVSGKTFHFIVWLLIAMAAILFVLEGFPHPRPEHLFLLIGLVYTAIFVQLVTTERVSRGQAYGVAASLFVITWFLRWSMWVRVVVGTGDYVAHFWQRAGFIVREGEVISTGMYGRNPVVHLLWAMNGIVTDLWIFDVRFIAILVSSLFPLLVIFLAKQVLDLRQSLIAGTIAGAYPLVMRTGAMFESEAVVNPLFVVALGLFLYLMSGGRDERWKYLFVFLFVPLAFTHSLYPVVLFGIFIGAYLLNAVDRRAVLMLLDNRRAAAITLFGLAAAFFFVFYRVVTTAQGQSRVARFLRGASTDLPSNILFIFVPSRGAIGASIATRGESTSSVASSFVPNYVMNWSPIVILLFFATLGGLHVLSLIRDNRKQRILFYVILTIFVVTVSSVFLFRSRTTFRIGYRMYYLTGVILLVLSALGTMRLMDVKGPGRRFLRLAVVVLILAFSTLAPMSTFANNVDPRFGGIQKGLTVSENEQLENIDRNLQGDQRIYPQRDLYYQYIRGPFVPRGNPKSDLTLHSSGIACTTENRIWSSDDFAVCSHSEDNSR